MKNNEKLLFSLAQRTCVRDGRKKRFDEVVRRLVLVVEAGDAGKNLTFKEFQRCAATG